MKKKRYSKKMFAEFGSLGWERKKEKYGEEKAKELNREAIKKRYENRA